MADGEVRAQDLAQETAGTLSGNEQFVMFDSTAGKRADIDDVATYIAGDKTTLKTTNKTSPVAAINENFDAIADVKEDFDALTDDALKIVVPYKAEDTATSTGSTSWENFTFLTHTRLKGGCKYSITMKANSTASGNIYVSIKKTDGTNATTCHITAGTTTKTVEYTAPADMEVYAYMEINLSTVYTVTGTIEKLNVDKDIVPLVYKKANAADIKPLAYSEYKNNLGFAIGSLNNGVLENWPYRISSDVVYKFDFPLRVSTDNTHRFGMCYFTSSSVSDFDSWSGWMEEGIIPADSYFKLQCARKTNETSSVITDAYDNDIFDALHIEAANSDILDNPIKIESHYDTRLWEQGACVVGNKYIGFSASNDTHTNTAPAWIGAVGTYDNQVTVTHNLGHCASADYNEVFDTMLVANGTTTEGVIPALYLIKNAKNIVDQGLNISVSDSNVTEIVLSTVSGEGVVACFGESNNIVYAITSDSAINFDTNKQKHIYRIALGVTNDEFDGTYTILNSYECEFYGELQGLKYLNGKLLLPMDVTYNSILTPFIMVINVNVSGAMIDKQYWLPLTDYSGARLRSECEDMIVFGCDAYVMTYSSAITDWRAHKLSICMIS